MGKINYMVFGEYSKELKDMTEFSIKESDVISIIKKDRTIDKEICKNICGKVIFVMDLNSIGVNNKAIELLEILVDNFDSDSFRDVVAAVFIKSKSELYTKSFSRKFILICNSVGISFIGHSVIEATASLDNYLMWQKTIDKTTREIALDMCLKQANRLREYESITCDKPKVLVLHASSHENSNTMMLWHKIKEKINYELSDKLDIDIDELHVEDGTVLDCKGCDFTTCMHYAQTRSCFYGGPMVKEILPKVEKADILIFIAPNYNDSISAKLMAVVNRLTVLYRIMSFNNKKIYGVIVSGNSGSDCVAMQIIDALNINKGFHLPPNFTIMETANDPKAILDVKNLDSDIEKFVSSFILDNFSR